MKGYNVWDHHLNADTKNFGGLEWVIDGENGRRFYPGSWAECKAVRAYRDGYGFYDIPEAYCSHCDGMDMNGRCLIAKEG